MIHKNEKYYINHLRKVQKGERVCANQCFRFGLENVGIAILVKYIIKRLVSDILQKGEERLN